MTYPSFSVGEVLRAQDMNAVGLWLVKSQAVGSGVSSVTVTGAFSADYDNYLVTYTNGVMSNDTGIATQLGSTATGYYGVYMYGLYTGGLFNAPDNNAAEFSYTGGGGSAGVYYNTYISNPFPATFTRIFSAGVSYSTNFGTYHGLQNSNTSHSSFKIRPLAGTMTGGTIRVYGYRN